MRENARDKGVRYVSEARLTVMHVNYETRTIRAVCRGEGAVYALGCDGDDWWCACPAKTRCAHLHALMLVTTRGRVESVAP
jgi:uncharacterized Zn finger protein